MLEITPIDFAEANAFVAVHHRHHAPVQGCKFCIAVSIVADVSMPSNAAMDRRATMQGTVVGVVIVGRPVSRRQDDGWTLEVTRLTTDGAPNACSMLYGAARRATKALGYQRLITYTLASETGSSVKAAGWTLLGVRRSGNWNVPSRPRIDTDELLRGQKVLWEVTA